eukprot:CAMPEP_0175986932 /NCGR_PEP_ID=MMETSP0108-20121206/50420_1 /TAXON_ID=195067 ORGANISM="Goniomonas pacifica, Strain CCMP1869" /NCGR_SAMPLE_ID=MMETSP0108 /ASSEMBLY_ACC=CAM_ASM_000204 /LENGTH=111 /DNA_ID=CAMNT_0017318137 /DNA_START=212 /DNA_END=548 /DNA_ORIENTATION=+
MGEAAQVETGEDGQAHVGNEHEITRPASCVVLFVADGGGSSDNQPESETDQPDLQRQEMLLFLLMLGSFLGTAAEKHGDRTSESAYGDSPGMVGHFQSRPFVAAVARPPAQ